LALLENAEHSLQRDINPTIYTPFEFAQRLEQGQSFLTKVMEQERLILFEN